MYLCALQTVIPERCAEQGLRIKLQKGFGGYTVPTHTREGTATATGKSKSWIRYLTYPRYQRRLASRKRSSANALELVELKEEQ